MQFLGGCCAVINTKDAGCDCIVNIVRSEPGSGSDRVLRYCQSAMDRPGRYRSPVLTSLRVSIGAETKKSNRGLRFDTGFAGSDLHLALNRVNAFQLRKQQTSPKTILLCHKDTISYLPVL